LRIYSSKVQNTPLNWSGDYHKLMIFSYPFPLCGNGNVHPVGGAGWWVLGVGAKAMTKHANMEISQRSVGIKRAATLPSRGVSLCPGY